MFEVPVDSSKRHRAIPATRPAFPYVGGKRNLVLRLVERIQRIPHQTYAEPFVGAGGVFLRRTKAAPAEVINDYSREVATFFRVLQRHYVPFMDLLKYQITTRVEFERLVKTDPTTLTDMDRAARLLYLQRTAYGGKVAGVNFGVSPGRGGGFNITKLGSILEEIHTRLAGVVIECLPYEAFIRRYDRPETLFFLDPPYWGSEGDYGADLFGRADFERLAELLASIQGRFLMTINDRPETRQVFKRFKQERLRTTYTIGRASGADSEARELLVSGR